MSGPRGALSLLSFWITATIAVLAIGGCWNWPESMFDLSPDSRIPAWFKIPPGMTRKDVTVKLTYYTGKTARATLFDMHGNDLADVDVSMRGLKPLHIKASGSQSSSAYPSYEILTASGTTEIIEHRKLEPIFYVTDDAEIISALLKLRE